jgi:hypothetical protein
VLHLAAPRPKNKEKGKNDTNKRMKIKHSAAGAIEHKKERDWRRERWHLLWLASALLRGSPGWVGPPF